VAETLTVGTPTIHKRIKTFILTSLDVTTTGEWEVTGLSTPCTLRYLKMELVSGTGATLNPKIGNVTGWTVTEIEHIGTNTTTNAFINDQTTLICNPTAGSIFINPGVNAGTDNVIDGVLVISEGMA